MSTTEQFSLRWNNFHSNLTSGFHGLLKANDLVDVTLSVEGQFLQAHKLVLSICSPLFKQLFKINPCKHPVIILRDVSAGNLKDILEFMYLGEVNVLRDNLSSFLRTAELLQVKGLTGDDSSETSSRKDDKSDLLGENELDQDIQQYSQLIESSEQSGLPHYSTPELTLPSSLPTTPASNIKRPAKSLLSSSKRQKSELNSNKSNVKTPEKQERSITPNQTNEDDSEYVECSSVKLDGSMYGSESDEAGANKDVIKHLLEYNNANLSTPQDSSSQDNDVLLYSVDSKGHVYCPYCYRKFVNRYNLKVHIRDKHDNNPVNLDCIICGKTMRNRSCLRVHLYHHRKQSQQVDEGDTSVE